MRPRAVGWSMAGEIGVARQHQPQREHPKRASRPRPARETATPSTDLGHGPNEAFPTVGLADYSPVRREPGLRIVPEQKAGRLVGLEEALSRNAKHPRRFAPC